MKFLLKIKSYIQPFEKKLAIMELESLTQSKAKQINNDIYQVITSTPIQQLINRLAYWEYVEKKGERFLTQQVRYENCVLLAKYEADLHSSGDIPLGNRRTLRYGVHGLHEYRGKFFPQLVRSLINAENLDVDANILDPMCGSGTTLVEAEILGCRAYGVDMNPLSVLMSKAKTKIAGVAPIVFRHSYEVLQERLQQHNIQNDWLNNLPEIDRKYIKNWFATETYQQIGAIIHTINTIENEACALLFTIALSNIIRRISYQKEADLRVRKEINDIKWDVKQEFLGEIQRSFEILIGFLSEPKNIRTVATVHQGDCRMLSTIMPAQRESIDAVITSPPYATALPYLDTDRLSLYCLSLMSRGAHRDTDYRMIGNREITNTLRREYWQHYVDNKRILPDNICSIIDQVYSASCNNKVGFRRKNLPALLAKYFFDMRAVLQEINIMLRHNASAFVVVGNNHTSVGTDTIEINTHQLLSQLGESIGLTCEQMIDMEMLTPRDIFKENSGTSERIICFRKL